jgi:hypothetical protein
MKALFEEPPGPLTRDNLTMHLNALSTVSQEDFRLFLMDMASKLQQCQTHSAGDSSLVDVCESDRPTRLPDLHKVLQDSTMYLNRSTTTSSLLQQHSATRTTLENQDWSHEFHHNGEVVHPYPRQLETQHKQESLVAQRVTHEHSKCSGQIF